MVRQKRSRRLPRKKKRISSAYPSEICVSRFDMKVEKVEDNTMGKITKTAVVDYQPFSGIYHLRSKSALDL